MGNTLHIDLSHNRVREETLDVSMADLFVGGRGIAAAMLFRETIPRVGAFEPANKLVIATGPLTGTIIPSTPKFCIASKCPANGSYGFSMASGFFGPMMKFAGYDSIIIGGHAEHPVYLWIQNEKTEIRDASSMWGLDTDDAQSAIRKELNNPKVEVTAIGPAGENMVSFACVITGDRACGRCGIGAVFGSKNLKAVVVYGDEDVPVANQDETRNVAREMMGKITSHEFTNTYRKYGTSWLVRYTRERGILPFRNFGESGALEAASGIDEDAFRKFVVKDSACHGCPIACVKTTRNTDGTYSQANTQGPQYESIWALGPQCGVDSMNAIIAANERCNQLGLDTISVGNIVGFVMECCEKGAMRKPEDLERDLRFGDHGMLMKLISMIANRSGFGRDLASGVEFLAKKIGASSYAMQVKGLEMPGYDVRATPGMGLAYATSPRGACHMRAWTIAKELDGEYELYSTKGRPALVARMQNERAMFDSTGLCYFITRAIPFEMCSRAISAVTGSELNETVSRKIGERIFNIERLLLARDGIRRRDDNLSERFFTEPLPSGPHKGQKLSRQSFEKMKDEYYEIRGWNVTSGIPTREKMRELGLEAYEDSPFLISGMRNPMSHRIG